MPSTQMFSNRLPFLSFLPFLEYVYLSGGVAERSYEPILNLLMDEPGRSKEEESMEAGVWYIQLIYYSFI